MWSMLVAEVRHEKSMVRRSGDTEGKLNSFCSYMVEAKMWMAAKSEWKTMDAGAHRALT